MKHRELQVKKGQVWVDKKNGDEFLIKGGRGDEWWGERNTGKSVTHHITRYMLAKRFMLKEEEPEPFPDIIETTMPKLLMLKGLPASGKSTRAKEIVTTGNYVRVNRDLIRTMLHFDKWSGRNEEATVNAEKAIALDALIRGLSVVVDDCNLNHGNKDMWKELAKSANATFDVEKVDTSMEECLERDKGREKAVGRHVIVNMALQYGLYPKPALGFILCDLDGTLADITHRLHYAKGETKDWHKFFEEIPNDTLRDSTLDLILDYEKKGHEIIFVSARPDTYRWQTEAWLEKVLKGYPIHKTLIMRKASDTRDDTEVKQQMYDTYFKEKYPIEAVIDDRPKVIRMWRENGINVIDVGAGIEF